MPPCRDAIVASLFLSAAAPQFIAYQSMKLTTVLFALLVVGGCILGGALVAGFVRGVLVENDPEYYILLFAVLAGVVATWALAHLFDRR